MGRSAVCLTGARRRHYTRYVISSESLATFGDRVAERSVDGRFPYSGQWELTCRCNLRCAMCYTDPFNTPQRIRQELTLSEIKRILHELSDAGCVELVLTGGEPLARPDFAEIYRTAHQLGLVLTVFTNATLITPPILQLWRELRPKAIEVSLHGVTRAVFERVTQVQGSYQSVIDALTCLLQYQLPVTFKSAALSINKEELLLLAAFARARGVAFRMGEYLRDDLAHSGAPFAYQLDEPTLRGIAAFDPNMRREKFADRAHDASAQGCAGGQETFHIDAYGGLQRCSNNRRQSYDLRQGSFKEGFYQAMPAFQCAKRVEPASAVPEPAHAG